jgi:hypothetical protein
MALMAAHGEIGPMPDCAIFADTGSEPAGVYEHLRWLMSPNVLPFPVHIAVAPGASLRERMLNPKAQPNSDWRPPLWAITDHGDAGPLNRQCTRYYKLDPIRRKMRELLGIKRGSPGPKQPVAEQWIGISLDETIRMKPSKQRYIENRWPLIEKRMNRWDCLQWMRRHGYPEPKKSACTFCPYRDNEGWRRMRDEAPADFADAVAVDAAVRTQLPGVKHSQVFVHRTLVPLDQVDLSTDEERGQLNLFLNECEGMCGV